MPARILILTSGNPCNNPRPVKEADALGRAGFDVTLLTPSANPIFDAIDQTLTAAAPYRHEKLVERRTLPTRARQWFARRVVALGLETVDALGTPYALLRRARAFAADLTIVHNEVPHWIGTRLIGDGRRVAADIEDWHAEDLLPQDRVHRPVKLLRRIEADLLRRALYTTTTSTVLAEALHAAYGGTVPQVITNAFPLQPVFRQGALSETPAFFWFSQTIGPGRGLEAFLKAWIRTRHPSRFVVLGDPSRGYIDQIQAQLPNEWRSRFHVRPRVSPAELPQVIAEHDIGLALEQSFIKSRNLTITNKLIQYLNAGLAVVASDTAGQREVFDRDPDIGVLVDTNNPEAFASALDRLLENRQGLAEKQRAARRLAETTYCWEQEAPRLVQLVTDVLAAPRTRR
jgi:glycosyltransferase involved in cell wall biosynthesis